MKYKVKIFTIILKHGNELTFLEQKVEELVNKTKTTAKVTWLSAAGSSFNCITAVVEYEA